MVSPAARSSLPELFRVPLAERMRPRSLDEVLGQEHLLGEGQALRHLIDSDQLTSMLLWGPPGSGKTTLARLLADFSAATFEPFSAVLGGLKDLREILARVDQRRREDSLARTLLFVDEIHRFNKAQQDAFLPHVESGRITLVGATTENPSFQVIGALLSRCSVHVLRPLSDEALRRLVVETLESEERGLGSLGLHLSEEATSGIIQAAGGDARRCLNAVEQIGLHFRSRPLEAEPLETDEIARALGFNAILYDRGGEEHYNVISAFIKSMRGSDPDAALYYLARMVEAGEDPLFVARRLVIFASEDVGLADPRAVQIAIACKDAVHFLGLPEARYPLAQATLYLATAPKSSSTKGYFTAADSVRKHGSLPVPTHLRNASTGLLKDLGYGQDYKDPHDFDGEFVPEEYLPEKIQGARFFDPSNEGYEKMLKERMTIWEARKASGESRKKR